MSQTAHHKAGPPIGDLHEVRATFVSPDAMQDAVTRLETSGFDRADLSLPEAAPPAERATPEAGAKPVDTEADARQARTLHTSGAAAAVGLAAAGVVIATGGAGAPAVAAAVLGGGAAAGIVHALSSASNQSEQSDRERKAATGTLILEVRAPNAEKRDQAISILRAAGGTVMEDEWMSAKGESRNHDTAVEDSFPASDPPSSSGIVGPRAAPRNSVNRTSGDSAGEARPKGAPTHERHATETAYQSEGSKAPDQEP